MNMLSKFDDGQTLDNLICALECREEASTQDDKADERAIKPMDKATLSGPSFDSSGSKTAEAQAQVSKSEKAKKHSPLKKMGSLLKESKNMAEGRESNQTAVAAPTKNLKRTISK